MYAAYQGQFHVVRHLWSYGKNVSKNGKPGKNPTLKNKFKKK